MSNQLTLQAIFENGVFRPTEPLDLPSPQSVTLIVQLHAASPTRDWPEDTAEIYREIAAEDRRLLQAMAGGKNHGRSEKR